jgi:tetratricopeptide (TPR) repeat protein
MFRITAMLLLALAIPAAAQQGGDLQAQIVYASQSEDQNALADLTASLNAKLEGNDGDASLRYHLAHAEYRYALLAAQRNPRESERAASGCVDQMKAVLKQNQHNVEALVLQSECYRNLADFRPIEAVLLRRLGAQRLDEALRLAPRNPRALLFTALRGLAPSTSDAASRGRALAQLRLAAELFGQTSATLVDEPGWGDTEAYLALGQELLGQGDLLGARNWIERALIASPDYKAAQRARAALAAH